MHFWNDKLKANCPTNVALRRLLTEDNYNFSDWKNPTTFNKKQDPRYNYWMFNETQSLNQSLREIMKVFLKKCEILTNVSVQENPSVKKIERLISPYYKKIENYKPFFNIKSGQKINSILDNDQINSILKFVTKHKIEVTFDKKLKKYLTEQVEVQQSPKLLTENNNNN